MGSGGPAPADTLASPGLGEAWWGRVDAGRRIATSYPEDGFYRADEKTWFSDDEVGYQRRVEARWVIICPWQNFEFDLVNGPPPASPIGSACRYAGLESDEEVIYVCMTGEFPDGSLEERFA